MRSREDVFQSIKKSHPVKEINGSAYMKFGDSWYNIGVHTADVISWQLNKLTDSAIARGEDDVSG